jgi:hypothetical protein
MADRQPLNATFFAFRKRERGGVLLGASLTYAVLALVVFGAFSWFNWQAFVDYINWSMTLSERQQGIDPNDTNAVFAAMTPPASVMSILPAAYEAACLRWMIRGETKGLFGLALDGDTLRVYFTYWLWFFLLIVVYLVVAVVGVGLGVGAVMSAQGGAESAGPAVLVASLVCLLLVLAVVYIAVRFAPAAATSIAKKRFAFFDAWTVTKGRFWPLLGSFVLLFLMFFVGAIVLSFGLGIAMGVGMMGQIDPNAEPSSSAEFMQLLSSPSVLAPVALVYTLMIVGSFVFYVAMFGVNARAAQAALEEGKIAPAT